MKNLKSKAKYLLLLIIPIAGILFTQVKATDNVTVANEAEFQNVVNKIYLTEKNDFYVNVRIKSGNGFSNKSVQEYCNIAITGIEKLGAFYAAGLLCDGMFATGGGGINLELLIMGTPLRPENYDKFMNFVKTEGDKMYAQTKDKEQLIKLVYNKINEMLSTQHDFFFNEESTLYYSRKTGYNLLASLFYDYFNIENQIIVGKTGDTLTRYWNLVNLGGNWYHIHNYSEVGMYLTSDVYASREYAWDYSAYPKASKDYVTSSVKETTSIKPLPKPEDIVVPSEPTTPGEPTKPTEPTTPVTDPSATASSWARAGVKEAIDSGLVPVHLQSRYQTNITREEFCELVVVLYEKLDKTKAAYTTNPFTDTTNEEVLKANALGIVSGVGNNKFAPKNLITREQIAVMFNNTLTALNKKPDKSAYIVFPDEAEISSWAKEAVQNLVSLEIMSGVGENRIAPKGNATIEQAILLANKMYIKYK